MKEKETLTEEYKEDEYWSFTIPSIENGEIKRKINALEFDEDCTIISVVMPDSIEEIGREAFNYCLNLKEIKFNSSLKRIDKEAFYGCFSIESPNSSILIGRKGKNLDAIQLLANVYAAKLDEDYKIIVDSEDYRMRHEEYIVRNAFKCAEYVRKSGKSKLLEPMNPFERRLIHTALNDFDGVETKSEGEGLYKQVRIIPVKNN